MRKSRIAILIKDGVEIFKKAVANYEDTLNFVTDNKIYDLEPLKLSKSNELEYKDKNSNTILKFIELV